MSCWGSTWGCLAKGSLPCAPARAIALAEVGAKYGVVAQLAQTESDFRVGGKRGAWGSEPHGRGLVLAVDPAILSISFGSFGLSLCNSIFRFDLLFSNFHFYFGFRFGALSHNACGSERTRQKKKNIYLLLFHFYYLA